MRRHCPYFHARVLTGELDAGQMIKMADGQGVSVRKCASMCR